MINVGDILVDRASGDVIRILKTAGSTAGEVFSFHLLAQNGSGGGSLHRHRNQEERFVIKKGTVKFWVKNRLIVANAGDKVVIPRNAAHTWQNDSGEAAELVAEFMPALKMEVLFETLCAAAQMGIKPPPSLDGLLQTAVTLTKYPGYNVAANMPYIVQRIAWAALSVPARLLGYKAHYSYDEAMYALKMISANQVG